MHYVMLALYAIVLSGVVASCGKDDKVLITPDREDLQYHTPPKHEEIMDEEDDDI